MELKRTKSKAGSTPGSSHVLATACAEVHLFLRAAEDGGDVRPMRTVVKNLRRKLPDDADSPTYIFKEPGVGYRMARGETQGQGERDEG